MPLSSSRFSGHGARDLSCSFRVDSTIGSSNTDFNISGDGEVLSLDFNYVTGKRLGSNFSFSCSVGETTVILGANSFDATDVYQYLGTGICCREELNRDRFVELVDTVMPHSYRCGCRYISI